MFTRACTWEVCPDCERKPASLYQDKVGGTISVAAAAPRIAPRRKKIVTVFIGGLLPGKSASETLAGWSEKSTRAAAAGLLRSSRVLALVMRPLRRLRPLFAGACAIMLAAGAFAEEP